MYPVALKRASRREKRDERAKLNEQVESILSKERGRPEKARVGKVVSRGEGEKREGVPKRRRRRGGGDGWVEGKEGEREGNEVNPKSRPRFKECAAETTRRFLLLNFVLLSCGRELRLNAGFEGRDESKLAKAKIELWRGRRRVESTFFPFVAISMVHIPRFGESRHKMV